jgi:hypothetical protein
MPEWLKALCIFLFLAGFIFHAFRQGFRVKPTPKQDNDSGYFDPGH